MTLTQILLSSYLFIGLLATIILLAALNASKRRNNHQVKSVKFDRIPGGLLHERKTRPSKSA